MNDFSPDLTEHLKAQLPEYAIVCDWKSDLGAFRFYLRHKDGARHVLQLSQELLSDSRPGELEARLEKSKLEALFTQHPDAVAVFERHGITFLRSPH